MPPGKFRKEAYTDEFLVSNGAAPFSTIIMTPTGYLIDDAWVEIVPRLTKGLRAVVEKKGAELGIDAATCGQLLIGLLFDGCVVHVKNLEQLINMADENILACNEGRDSSEINQAFDRFEHTQTHTTIYIIATMYIYNIAAIYITLQPYT